MSTSIHSNREHASAFGLSALILVIGLAGSATPAAAQTIFSEDFDHPPPYDAILDPTDPGGWEVSLDPFPGWPVHNGIGNYARAHDFCGGHDDRLLRLPAAGTLIDLGSCAAAVLHLWAAHGTCFGGCMGGVDTCRLALRTFVTPAAPFTEVLLLDFPDPVLVGCGGPGAWTEDLVYDLSPYFGLYVQVVVYHATATIDHLVIDNVRVSGTCGSCPAPSSYCTTSPNSVGPGMVIDYAGSTSASAQDLELLAFGGPPNKPGIFFYGPTQVMIPFGNGVRCVGAGAIGTFRLPVVLIDAFGDASHLIDWNVPPACCGAGMLASGDVWNFQFWYRDPAAGGANFNFSDGLEVTFCP